MTTDHAFRRAYDRRAQLEAAAPELLAACRAVITWAETPGNHGGNPYCKSMVLLAQAAIEKAEGKGDMRDRWLVRDNAEPADI